MPVTIQVAKHNANPVSDYLGARGRSSQNVLEGLASKNSKDIGAILTTTLGQQTSLRDEKLSNMHLSVQDHGLVYAAYYAYSKHHHLVLRPEDIWFAILTQFSYYVNANAEELRSSFVSHKGKKGLILRDPGQPDMGLMCRNMTKLIDESVVDPELRAWIMPSFTTTTVDDEVVAAIIMMGTLQKYFDYVFDSTCCGIPSVTLLGELSDWQDLLGRIEKLATFGEEPTHFCEMLRPVLQHMVSSFTAPEDPATIDFWGRIIERKIGSGTDNLTGWMLAFCVWDEDGRFLAKWACERVFQDETPTAASYWYMGHNYVPPPAHLRRVVSYSLAFKDVPRAFVSVPVTYITPDEEVISTKLLAGHVGFECLSSGGQGESDSTGAQDGQATSLLPGGRQLDTVRPTTGWWMYQVKEVEDSDRSRGRFYRYKRENDWNNQASTGVVEEDGQTVVVHQGLPQF